MAFVEIGVGTVWIALGALMVRSGLFDRNVMPPAFWRLLGVPAAMLGAFAWLVRLALRTGLGIGNRKARASR